MLQNFPFNSIHKSSLHIPMLFSLVYMFSDNYGIYFTQMSLCSGRVSLQSHKGLLDRTELVPISNSIPKGVHCFAARKADVLLVTCTKFLPLSHSRTSGPFLYVTLKSELPTKGTNSLAFLAMADPLLRVQESWSCL